MNFGIPLKKLQVNATVTDSIVQIDFIQTFKNDSEFAIESSFTFPSDPEIVISKMFINVGERVIETKVVNKEQAEEKYDDAVSGGNMAAILTQKKD